MCALQLSHSGALRTQWVVMSRVTKTANYLFYSKLHPSKLILATGLPGSSTSQIISSPLHVKGELNCLRGLKKVTTFFNLALCKLNGLLCNKVETILLLQNTTFVHIANLSSLITPQELNKHINCCSEI